jgi:hypothetical protein
MLTERTIPAWLVAVLTGLAGIFMRLIPRMPEGVKGAISWSLISFSLWYVLVEIFRWGADIRTVIIRANIMALAFIIIASAHVYIQRAGGYWAAWRSRRR